MAAAILDPLLYHCHVIATHGPSYGMKDKLCDARLEEPEEAATM
jgi:hypothetical protein